MEQLFYKHHTAFTDALGWALLHSLWQGALLAALLFAARPLLHRQSPQIRYLAALCTLASMLLAFAGTLIHLYTPPAPVTTVYAEPEGVVFLSLNVQSQIIDLESCNTWTDYYHLIKLHLQQHLALIVSIWMIGMVLYALRFVSGLGYVMQVRYWQSTPAPDFWWQRMNTLQLLLSTHKSVQLLESAWVKVPQVIGWLRPAIIFPIGMLTALPPREIESILAHELAHIHRNDYLINLLQSLVEILLFYHPAVWWVSARIHEAREHCCDDIAVALTGDSLVYARALSNIAAFQLNNVLPAMAASGKAGSLLFRVQRILQKNTYSPAMKKQSLRLQVFPARFTGMLLLGISMFIYTYRSEAEAFTEEVKLQASNLVQKTEEKVNSLIKNEDNAPNEDLMPKPIAKVEVSTEGDISEKETSQEKKELSVFNIIENNNELKIERVEVLSIDKNSLLSTPEYLGTLRLQNSLKTQLKAYSSPYVESIKDSLKNDILTRLESSRFKIDSPIVHKIGSSNTSVFAISRKLSENPLFILDGKEISKDEFGDISVAKIASLELLKGDAALKKYGEKGRDGVVIMYTNDKALTKVKVNENLPSWTLSKGESLNSWTLSKGESLNMSQFSDDTFFVLDGKKTNKAELSKVAPQDIAHVEVLDEHIAKRKYGEDARYAVVLTTQAYAANASERLYSNEPAPIVVNRQPLLNTHYPALSSVLPMSNNSKVVVLKNKTATDLYGEAAKHGVFVFTTKDSSVFQGVKEDFISLSSERSDGIYPNPSDGQFIKIQMQVNEESEVRVDVYDASGRLVEARNPSVFRLSAGSHEVPWYPRNELSTGTYIVHVLKGKQLSTSRVVIQK